MKKIRSTLSKPALEYLERFPQLFHCTTAGCAATTREEGGDYRRPDPGG